MKNWFKGNADLINAIANIVIAIVAVVGFAAGVHAWRYYKEANEIAFNNVFESADNKVHDIALENNKPYLLRILYYNPPNNLPSRERANLYYQSLFDKDVSIKWITVPELLIYYHNNKNAIRTDEGKRVTEAILMFERILSLSQGVLNYSNNDMIVSGGWEKYVKAYLDDFADNPYFLAAIHLDHVYGYIDKSFSKFLVNRFINNPMVREIYPEMFMSDWLNKHGKKII